MTTSDGDVKGSAWQHAHEVLVKLAAARAGLDFEEGQRFREALQAGVHLRLGYGSFVEYVEVSGEAFAAFREAMANIRRDAGGPLDDDATLLLMAR